jgi:sugar phosphate permease
LGICLVGVAAGAFISSQALHWIIQSHGWRAGYLLAAIVSIALPLPLGLILVEHPTDMGLLADGDAPAEAKPADAEDKAAPAASGGWPGLPLIDALHTRAFWLLCASTALHFVALQGVLGHLVPMVLAAGYVGRVAALALGLTVGLSAAGRIGFGYLSDLYSKKLMYATAMFAVAAGIAMLFGISRSAICLMLFITFFAMGTGGSELLPVMLVGEYFGPAAMGSLVGLVFGISLLIGSIGPFMTGKLYDLTVTYWDAYLGLFVIAALGAVAVLGMSKPNPAASLPSGAN